MPGALTLAGDGDVGAVVALRNAVADDLTARHGIGHWSSQATARGIRAEMKRSSFYVFRDEGCAVATLQLQTKKPWTIDRRYFTPERKPLYLLGMAVEPGRQRTGIGRCCIEDAVRICRDWPASALCLDAYDADAGAGDFYRRCGFTEVGRATYRNTSLIYFERLINA
jgi:GNAT superfamily N-acetyltransferase